METTILIALLCMLIGIIIALVGISLLKSLSKGKKNSSKKSSKRIVPTEFSKKILVASYIIAIVVIIYTMYIIHLMVVGGYVGDPSSLNTLIMLTLGELGVANSFYFWKAKTENLEKIRRERGAIEAEEIKNAVDNEDY